jgi:RNase P subunit RPR2
MDDTIKICETCGKPLKPSQYARIKLEGQSAEKSEVCRNYPECPKAEKEIDKSIA